MSKLEIIKHALELLAKEPCWSDNADFEPIMYCGGNYDDAYDGGVTDGYTKLARLLLKKYFSD